MTKHWSKEQRAKMRIVRLRQIPPMLGKHHSEAAKNKIRLAKMGEKNPNWKGDEALPDTARQRAQLRYKCPEGMERHHIDGNPLNNASENIMLVTRKEHVALDNRLQKFVNNGRINSAKLSRNPDGTFASMVK